MTNQIAEKPTLAAAGSGSAEFIQAEINKLKGRLEEKQARSHAVAHWEKMIEDCEIILKHLNSKKR